MFRKHSKRILALKNIVSPNIVSRNVSSKTIPAIMRAMPIIENLEDRTFLSASSIVAQPLLQAIPDAVNSTVEGFSPSQINTAYGFINDSIPGGGTPNGSGQTIAIVDAYNDPNIYSDLSAFDSHFGLPAASLSVINEMGSSTQLPNANSGWDLEISLDVEWAHAIAPGANILLVETNTSGLGDLLQGVNYAKNVKNVSVVSMSWGTSEFFSETAYDSYFTTPSGHQGVTFVAASGDEGSWSGPEWPSVSSNVLSVGGTTLSVATAAGNYSGETGWSDSTGGVSDYEPEAAFQEDVQNTGAQTSPDVSYDANPSTGFAVYDSNTYEGSSGWWELGGTSSGAPQWSGLIAIADQGRAAEGESTLNGSTQTLPLLFSLYSNQTQYTDSFRDETSGSSSWYYSAGPGYDLVTGLGSPHAAYLIRELISATATGTVGSMSVRTGQSQTVTPAFDMGATHAQPPVAAVVSVPVAPASPALQAPAVSPLMLTTNQSLSFNMDSQATVAPSMLSGIPATTASIAQPNGHHELTSALGDVAIVSSPGADPSITSLSPMSAFRTVSAMSGASTDIVEHALISSASALTQVADTLAARIFEENVSLWQDAAALTIAAAVISAVVMRDRPKPAVTTPE